MSGRTLFIENENYLSKETYIDTIKAISLKMGMDYTTHNEYEAHSSIPEEISLFYLFASEEIFYKIKNDNYPGINLGVLFSITIYGTDSEEDEVTFLFVKELMSYFPTFIVLNEDLASGPIWFTKAHLDVHNGSTYYDFFCHPPSDII
jgi:hypothetical protein